MSKSMRPATLLSSLLLTMALALPMANAKAPSSENAPRSGSAAKQTKGSLGSLKANDFVVTQDGHDYQMRIKDIGSDDEGFIDYSMATAPNGETIVQIDGVKGVKNLKGVGEALKKEVLRRHPKRQIRSQLVNVNASKLLAAWAKGYPHRASDKNGESLRSVVPALKFEGFDYEISAQASRTGSAGSISLEMRSAKKGKGSIRIKNPLDLDKVLLASPERSKISASKLAPAKSETDKGANGSSESDEKERAQSERGAKAASSYIKKLAKDLSKKQSFSADDLKKHLWKEMDSSCGRGGTSGGGWSQGCIFTKKGGSYKVQPRGKKTSLFTLDDHLKAVAKQFAKKR